MYKSTFERLVLENSQFMENISSTSEKYQQLLKENDSIYKKLKDTLNKEQIKMLDNLIFNHMGLEAEAVDCYLEHGFKTGLRLIVECFN